MQAHVTPGAALFLVDSPLREAGGFDARTGGLLKIFSESEK
jgi:hypothetical protein